jgi:hypothetical protein
LSDSKRTGSRDISDLKARLGLKKGAAPASGQTRANGGQSGGVVPPPGLNLPPPPGLQPQQPVIPNAAEDPFGAMNAMAAVGTVQRAPEIVIVHDGRPVENVGSKSTGATIAKIAIPAVVFLVIGLIIGNIGTSAGAYNDGVKDAKQILGDKGQPASVADLKQTLSAIDTALEAAAKNQFKPNDALNKQLKTLATALANKPDGVFSKQNALDPKLSGQIVAFYAGIAEVKSMLDYHLQTAVMDATIAKKADDKNAAATLKENEVPPSLVGQRRYAVLVQAPTETEKGVDVGAKIVEIGGVFCDEKGSPRDKCPEGQTPVGIAYRADIAPRTLKDPPFTNGKLAPPTTTDAIPSKMIVALLPGTVGDQLFKTAEGSASETFYQRRLRALYELVHGRPDKSGATTGGLLKDGNDLEDQLKKEIAKGSRFSFGF